MGKVLLDLGVWCVIWAVPTTALAYAFMDNGFTWAGLRRWMTPGWFPRKVVPIIVSNFLRVGTRVRGDLLPARRPAGAGAEPRAVLLVAAV